MKKVSKLVKSNRTNVSNIPNAFIFTFIRNWLLNKQYTKEREKYFIGDLSSEEVSLVMREIKWLTKNFKGLDIITIEDNNGNKTQILL